MIAPVDISVVVPVYRSEDTLDDLVARIRQVLSVHAPRFEIIFVDDFSPDRSWSVIEQLATAGRGSVIGLRLKENVGQHMAVLVGLSAARGAVCIVLDADLQDPPEAIPELLAQAQGSQAVFGGRSGKYDSRGRLLTSSLYHGVISRLARVPADAGMFFAIPRAEVDKILLMRVSSPSIVAMIGLSGARCVSRPVQRHKRTGGRSAYSAARRVLLAIRMLRCVLEWRSGAVKLAVRTKVAPLLASAQVAGPRHCPSPTL